jgi:aspartyl-tRNA(Asn)/glutamyl-tRNA(Gln) amidotransferase subunit C
VLFDLAWKPIYWINLFSKSFMTEQITPELFNHLVELAALELDATQAEYLRHELNNQLKAIHELEAIPIDEKILPALHGVPFPHEISPGLRSDEWQSCLNPEEILGQVPDLDSGFIVVPDIPHTELD